MKVTFLRFIGFSIFFHAILFFGFSFYIERNTTPYIFIWPSVLDRNELFTVNKDVSFIAGIKFIRDAGMDKEYFLPPIQKPHLRILAKNSAQTAPLVSSVQDLPEAKIPQKSIYLWERPQGVSNTEEGIISYKAFVSPYGKVVLSFPEKLPLNSAENIASQEYNRQAILFLKDKFFWTKWETMVR